MIPRQVSFRFLCFSLILVSSLLFSCLAFARGPEPMAGLPDKALVVDGRFVHDVGQVWHHVTNWGLLGSAFGVATTFSDAPSCMWPGGSGHEYLWSGGLWVGAVKQGQPLVSTGAWAPEWRPTEAASDTIVRTGLGAAGGARYPAPDWDDDGDGREDEDLPNGLDDDGDGLVDEDFAAYGDQHFICTYRDNDPSIQEIYPDHTPLDVEVVQQSIQWGTPEFGNFVGYDFTITNIGATSLEQLHVGMFADHDIGPRGLSGLAGDDLAGFASETVTLTGFGDDGVVPVQVAYMYDGAAGPLPGYVGWVLLDHTTDPTGTAAPAEARVRSFQKFSGNSAFENGGDPTNDAERYDLLSRDEWDASALPGTQADYRVLLSSGPFATLAPGESLRYQVALVLGDGLDDMLANAARARLAYAGQTFDRDGDPLNGQEYRAHWLLASEVEVAADAGRLTVTPVSGGREIHIEANLNPEQGLAVARLEAGRVTRTWSGGELEFVGAGATRLLYRFLDTDPVNGSVSYRLVRRLDLGELVLDEQDYTPAARTTLALSAAPNPFNPQVNIELELPRARTVTLEAFDARGHRVATLLSGPVEAGPRTVSWQGVDAAGRALPSGVYRLRLTAGGEVVTLPVTLLR